MERVILVGVFQKKRDLRAEHASLEELHRLSETAGARIMEVLTQRVDRLHPRSLIGEGKVGELARAVKSSGAHTVIFDHDLSPAQQIHLESEAGAKIVDRTRLILDIFAKRARTKEGELQIELAQLSYMLPRLTGSWRSYSQQVGGIGTRGPGERQLEYERRHIQLRIRHLKRDIKRLEGERALQRRRRSAIPVPSVALIGYTNAGKSSMLNRLMGAQKAGVYADDKLFATLDPTTRRVRLPEGGWAVFTDTVGFISNLPTTLIAAFRSTLEEVARADCLIHIEDGLSPHLETQRTVVEEVLRELGANDLPRFRALNKCDLIGDDQRARFERSHPETPLVSTRTGEGLEAMLGRVQSILNHRWLLRELTLEGSQTRHLDEVYRSAQVVGQSTRGGGIVLKLRVTPENWGRLRDRVGRKAGK